MQTFDQGIPHFANAKRPRELVPAYIGSTKQGEALRYGDSHLIDRMLRQKEISNLEYDAMEKLLEMYIRAGQSRSATANYGNPRRSNHSFETSGDDELNRPTPADHYRRLARDIGLKFEILENVCHGIHPGNRLTQFHTALRTLIDHWGMDTSVH